MAEATTSVEISEIRGRLAEILDGLLTRQERVVLTRDGEPVAEIRPVGPPAPEEEGEAVAGSWLDKHYGVLADDEEFDATMEAIIRSRQDDMPRPFSLDGGND